MIVLLPIDLAHCCKGTGLLPHILLIVRTRASWSVFFIHKCVTGYPSLCSTFVARFGLSLVQKKFKIIHSVFVNFVNTGRLRDIIYFKK